MSISSSVVFRFGIGSGRDWSWAVMISVFVLGDWDERDADSLLCHDGCFVNLEAVVFMLFAAV